MSRVIDKIKNDVKNFLDEENEIEKMLILLKICSYVDEKGFKENLPGKLIHQGGQGELLYTYLHIIYNASGYDIDEITRETLQEFPYFKRLFRQEKIKNLLNDQ